MTDQEARDYVEGAFSGAEKPGLVPKRPAWCPPE